MLMFKRNLGKQIVIFMALLAIWGSVYLLIQTGIINPFYELNLILIGINIILAVSLNLINGFNGQFSIGHAGFMAIGAYGAAIITIKAGLPFPVALLFGAVVAGIFGILVGLPTLRLRGDYLAIATLGFGEIIRGVIVNIDYIGGAYGLSGIPKMANWTWVFWLTVLTVVIITNFINSTHGRATVSIRENEIAAEAMGINTTKYKVMAFTIGSFFAGLAGGLHAHYFYTIQPGTFNFLKSFDILVMVVLGGQGSITGSIIAAIGLTILSASLQSLVSLRLVIYALLLIIIMIFRPQGLMGTKEFSLSVFGEKSKDKGEKQHGTSIGQ
ncbi:amino acid/amide ABC transporter membrane protein 2, HAAT family [Desulforamulus reducens MI-1]|uniref:Amino acid/amide ABC transporter membrane protein 2, HAAT family n=1 Tax=Desulforamulus reducens (strain ATCC BAA-1160 / DSM 100696 / MI-1) TaxID=349161 RepID=A4J6P8_DESRM|nr:branched-chain amino acid ABC transporter permease [Desulforamulus reducens]ABO50751.1 amino acid/amide ABC transporter membrane protein 2, HAAT family [Desulforamulus reducens MI-1]